MPELIQGPRDLLGRLAAVLDAIQVAGERVLIDAHGVHDPVHRADLIATLVWRRPSIVPDFLAATTPGDQARIVAELAALKESDPDIFMDEFGVKHSAKLFFHVTGMRDDISARQFARSAGSEGRRRHDYAARHRLRSLGRDVPEQPAEYQPDHGERHPS